MNQRIERPDVRQRGRVVLPAYASACDNDALPRSWASCWLLRVRLVASLREWVATTYGPAEEV